MRYIAALLPLALAFPALAQRPNVPKASDAELTNKLAKGETLESRVDGDLNGDGQIDTAFVGRSDDSRALYVLFAVREETFMDHDVIGKGPLAPYALGSAELAITRGVLTVKDLVGGTSATQGTYRLRYDPAAKKMRLIGLDTTYYSRTWAHDGRETSWNLLTGDRTTRLLKLRAQGGPYDPGPVIRTKKPFKPVYLDKLPDLEGFTPG